MMSIPFILLLCAWGVLSDPLECMIRERGKCDPSLLPREYPNTPEELQTICRNMITFGTCMLEVQETCDYSIMNMEELSSGVRFINSVCKEDNHINEVISSNLECISPAARKADSGCIHSRLTKDNYEAIMRHQSEISENFQRLDVLGCLHPLWEVSCRSIVLGFHCGSEVEEAVRELLVGMSYPYKTACTTEILQELQPLIETYKTIIEAEQRLQQDIEERK